MQIACIAACALVAQTAAGAGPLSTSTRVTLRDAIGEALLHSPLLGPAADQLDAAAVSERLAKSAFAPNLTPALRIDTAPNGATERALGLDVAKRFSVGTAVTMGVAGRSAATGFSSTDLGYTLSISQPLLRGFGATTKAPLDQARRNVFAAGRAGLEARRDLILAVAAAYLDALQADRVAVESDRAVERAVRLRRASAARVAVGLATELDVSRAEWLQSRAEASRLDVRDRVTDARDRLKRLLGRPVDSDLDLAEANLADPASILAAFIPPAFSDEANPSGDAERLASLTAMAFAARADAAEARDRVVDAERAVRVARWDLLPQVNLEVGYARAGLAPTAAVAPLSALVNGWRVGLSTDYSFNRASSSASAANAEIGVRAAKRVATDVDTRIADEVRRASRDWIRTAAAIDLQTKAVAMVERQLRLSEIRYERGVAGNFDITDAETNLYEAQTSLVAAQAAHALAGLTLRRAAGALDPDTVR